MFGARAYGILTEVGCPPAAVAPPKIGGWRAAQIGLVI